MEILTSSVQNLGTGLDNIDTVLGIGGFLAHYRGAFGDRIRDGLPVVNRHSDPTTQFFLAKGSHSPLVVSPKKLLRIVREIVPSVKIQRLVRVECSS